MTIKYSFRHNIKKFVINFVITDKFDQTFGTLSIYFISCFPYCLWYNCQVDMEISINDFIWKVHRRGATLILKAKNFIADKIRPWTGDADELIALLLVFSVFMPFYFTVATVCAVAILVMINGRIRAKAFEAPYSKFLLGFLVVPFFVSATYNNYWGMLYAMVILALVMCAFYIRSIMTRRLFNRMMDLACAASIWATGYALVEKIVMLPVKASYRPMSLFHNANCYGMMIEFVIIIAIYRIFTNAKQKKFYFAVVAANLFGLYLCASISSLVALSAAALVFLMMKGKYRLAGGLVLAGVLFFALGLFVPDLLPRDVPGIDKTMVQRLDIWITSLKGIREHPLFGTGAMSYQMIYERFAGYKTYHSHNLLLDTLLNYGFVGLGAFGAYIILQLKLLGMRFRNHICSNMNILMAVMFVAVLVHGLTDVTIAWIQTGLLFLMVFSSTGIGSAHLERKLRLPSLLPEYTEEKLPQPAYLKN